MDSIMPRFKYCPMCATPLVEQDIYHGLRLTCPDCGFINFLEPKVVAVIVIEDEDKILLGKRNIDPGMGRWSFVSGYVERGEKLEEAAIREVKEETNLDVRLERLIGIYSERDNPHIVIAFAASITNNNTNEIVAQPDEVSELAFFALDRIPTLAFPTDTTILQALRQQAGH
ncbi:MAG TPA: NUDIX hydrolase [Ktedonobacteraceae bacterium]|nr:NUDIX hydrolase [Ktedonobacteraceae bacterium]